MASLCFKKGRTTGHCMIESYFWIRKGGKDMMYCRRLSGEREQENHDVD
jgi:hypothetical protein